MLARHGWRNWPRIKAIHKPTQQRARRGKKLSERLAEEVAAFAVPRPLRLMFQDEARFGRISDVRHCWDKKPHRPMVRAMLTQQYTYAYGAVSPLDGRFDSLILPWVNGDCMQFFVDEIAARYPQEHVWDELLEKFFHNRAFDSLDALEIHLESELKNLESSQETMRSITGWDWVINAVPK